jgi:hypothetical protein
MLEPRASNVMCFSSCLFGGGGGVVAVLRILLIWSGSSILGWIPYPDPIRIQGFYDQKLKKCSAEKKIHFFWIKTTIYLSLGLHKGCPSYRRNLQLSQENIQHFKTWNFLIFSNFVTFVGHICPPGSVSGSTDPIESGSTSDPDPPWE